MYNGGAQVQRVLPGPAGQGRPGEEEEVAARAGELAGEVGRVQQD